MGRIKLCAVAAFCVFAAGNLFWPAVFAFPLSRKDKAIELTLKELQKQYPPKSETVMPKPPEYVVGEDDVLDITVWKILRPAERKTDSTEEYLISKGDTLEISVWQWPDLLKDVIVRPDGKISYPLVGDLKAEGMTLEELQRVLADKLKDYIKNPQVSVMVKQFGAMVYGAGYTGKIVDLPFVKIDDLSGEQTVRPDGRISISLLGELEARGRTLPQLTKDIKAKVLTLVKDCEVTITITEFGGRKVMVFGAVAQPGVYEITGKFSILDAIAAAQGYTRDAILKNVVVIDYRDKEPSARAYNVLAAMKQADLSQNAVLDGGEVVYVPISHISNLSYVLTQLISPLLTSSSAPGAIKTIRMGTSTKK
ncbi:MAG: polysaccharide biosynthesis/export family protein [Candidatus Omnitrophota bacterium]